MEQNLKELLLKDLCARVPYHPKGHVVNACNGSMYDEWLTCATFPMFTNIINNCRLYLRPMSSMTEEELNECVCQSGIKDIECPNWQDIPKEKQFEARLNHSIAVFLTDSNNVDWLNKHHFDYRGLIENGLALEAQEGMYNFNLSEVI